MRGLTIGSLVGGQQPEVETIVAWWAAQNNCSEVEEVALPNLDPTDGSDVDLIRHHGGDNGYQTRVYRVNGGGHDWFGAFGNMDVSSAVEMWDFWRQFCDGTADLEPTPSPERDLFQMQDGHLWAIEACEFQVVDLSGRTRMLRPLQGGQRLDLTHFNGIYLLVARTANGIQTSKVILGE